MYVNVCILIGFRLNTFEKKYRFTTVIFQCKMCEQGCNADSIFNVLNITIHRCRLLGYNKTA